MPLFWKSVFAFLVAELVVAAVLSAPVPIRVRNRLARFARKLELERKLRMPAIAAGIFLTFLLYDCYSTLQDLKEEKEEDETEAGVLSHDFRVLEAQTEDQLYHKAKDHELEFRTQRNMYIAGFALTLLFAIDRLAKLMQEHVDLEDELSAAIMSRPILPTEKVNTEKDPAIMAVTGYEADSDKGPAIMATTGVRSWVAKDLQSS